MKPLFSVRKKSVTLSVGILFILGVVGVTTTAQQVKLAMRYTISMADPASRYVHVELNSSGWNVERINLKMPAWMPGYYQLMDYANAVEHITATDENGRKIPVVKINDNCWQLSGIKNKTFRLNYDVKATRQFVANSFIDSMHAYIVPAGMFLYVDGFLKTPVSVNLILPPQWKSVATGLERVGGSMHEYTAPDFDILYDCPLLAGNLEELPPFTVKGITHRFIGYNMADFNRTEFMKNLKKIVEAAVDVIGDIPYNEYTFIGIGPGRGGIEHLNNCTVSFDGKGLQNKEGFNTTMIFLAHEYFHNYNVKRIRPLELGPFNYDNATRTNLLWVSEGLSVYYEYMIARRAGLSDEQTLFGNFEKSFNATENDPGRKYQSLVQASYETWSDGPFGSKGKDGDRSISYYDKGPLVGLLLDLAIRHASGNKKSLDDVMRFLYNQYYKELNRGFTDAEFQQSCERIAGSSLSALFEFVYTTREPDYNTYLAFAGLKLTEKTGSNNGTRQFVLERIDNPDASQVATLQAWLGK